VTGEEALRRLEQRLNRASEMAERLIVEAAARMASEGPGSSAGSEAAGAPPPAGASEPPSAGESGPPSAGESGPPSAGESGPPSAGESGPSPGGNPKPPPAGWQQARPRRPDGAVDGEGSPGASGAAPGRSDLDALLALLNAVRDRIPPELQHRLGEALREVMLAVRALIDWYLERTERRRADSDEVQDIPIL
jgi:hypothetical protein